MSCLIQTLCVLLALFVASLAVEVDLPELGVIDGSTTYSYWINKPIYQYKGIPYAKPPIGDLRFKKPVKYDTPWRPEVLNMSLFGPICPQNSEGPWKTNHNQSEDCLTLNVYTKKIEGGGIGSGLPVMFYIHGGSFRVGSARGVTPEYLLEEEVLLVSVQYRLGPLGFLSLKTEEIPGNQGMLDVILALEWVRDNIEHFGGDPSRVTVFGQSAGAAAVTSLLFSPLAKGLIHGLIAQSGALVGTWATDADPVTHGKEIAALAGCTEEAVLAACLRGKDAQQILDAHTAFLIKDIDEGGRAVGGNHLVWGEAGAESFLPDNPEVMLKKGDYTSLPMMAGITKHEGSWFLWNVYDMFVKDMNLTDEQWKDYMERNITKMVLDYSGIHDSTGYVDGFMRDKYFTKEEIGNFDKMVPGLIDIIGVALLKASTFTFATHISRHAPCFYYSFNFLGRHTTFNDWGMTDPPFTGGVAHSDDLFYLFPLGKHELLDAREASVVRIMVDLWTSFAINGAPSLPNLFWPPLTTYAGPYLKIDVVPRVYEDFIDEEYMIAVKEGLLVSKSTTITVSILTVLAAISVHL